MYSLRDFQIDQALQRLPFLFDQCPYELMDKMLVLLPEDDKKPGFFFRGLFMDCLSADIQAHLLSPSMTLEEGLSGLTNLGLVNGCSLPAQF